MALFATMHENDYVISRKRCKKCVYCKKRWALLPNDFWEVAVDDTFLDRMLSARVPGGRSGRQKEWRHGNLFDKYVILGTYFVVWHTQGTHCSVLWHISFNYVSL